MHADPINKITLIILFLCATASISSAQSKNFYINRTIPSWVVKINSKGEKVNDRDVSDGYYASLIEHQNHVELQEKYTHVVRQIISDAGVQNGSQISVTYDPAYEKLTFHDVTIWRDHHPYNKLNAAQFKVLQNEKDLSKFIYSGTFDAYLLLDDVRKGDRIEYAYTIKGNNPVFGNKYADEFYFEGAYSNGHSYTNMIVSKNRKLNFKNFNFKAQPKISDKGGLKLYEWESKNTDTYEDAQYDPSWYNPFKRTQISEYQSWSEVVDWGLRVNYYGNLKTPLVDKLVASFQLKAKHQPLKYLELVTRFVQDEIRYMGIEMGEYSQRPNSPEKVLKQRYGDCKDKSLLLVYLLNKANIKAYMAYVDTYAGKKMKEFLPSPFLFDHVVVVVEYGQQKKWIDPTISYQRGPFKKLYFPDYGQALVLKKGIQAPENVISLNTGTMVANLTFKVADTNSTGKTSLIIKSKYTGRNADNIRSMFAGDGADGVEKSYLDYIKGYYPDAEVNSGIKIKDNEKENIIELTESYLIGDFWQEEERKNPRTYVYFYGDLIHTNLRDINLKDRTEPLSLKYPLNIEQHIKITLPYISSGADESMEVENSFFLFNYDSIHKGHDLYINYYYKGLKEDVGVNELKAYLKDSKKVDGQLSYTVFRQNEQIGGELNSYMITLALLSAIVSGFYFLHIYQQRMEFDIVEMTNAKSVRGLLIIVGAGLILELLCIPYSINHADLFGIAPWNALDKLDTFPRLLLSAALSIITAGNAIQCMWLVLLFFLFINRRELLPYQFIKYILFATIFLVFNFAVDCVMNSVQHKPFFQLKELISTLACLALSAFWIFYFKRSNRVRETFVFTYPEYSWKKALIEYQKTEHKKNN